MELEYPHSQQWKVSFVEPGQSTLMSRDQPRPRVQPVRARSRDSAPAE